MDDNLRVLIISALNARAAELNELGLLVHRVHVNLTGPNFPELHQFFGSLYERLLTDYSDQIMERVRALGGVAADVPAMLTSVPTEGNGVSLAQGVRTALREVLARLSATRAQCAGEADPDTYRVLDDVIHDLNKPAWMLDQIVVPAAEPLRKRLGFLRGDAIDKAEQHPSLKVARDAAKVADKAHERAMRTHALEDHAAASAAAKIAAERAGEAYRATGRVAQHDARQSYEMRLKLHGDAALGDRGAVGVLHAQSATGEKWGKKGNRAAEAAHAAQAVNAALDARDKHLADAAEHRAAAEQHEAENRAKTGLAVGNYGFSGEANRARNARNDAMNATLRAAELKDSARRTAEDHAAALSSEGYERDERGRFARKGS